MKLYLFRENTKKIAFLTKFGCSEGSRSDRKCRGIQISFINKNIVEIDETLLVQRKHKKGRHFEPNLAVWKDRVGVQKKFLQSDF